MYDFALSGLDINSERLSFNAFACSFAFIDSSKPYVKSYISSVENLDSCSEVELYAAKHLYIFSSPLGVSEYAGIDWSVNRVRTSIMIYITYLLFRQ